MCYDAGMVLDIVGLKYGIKKIAEANGLSLVMLFGSHARGRTHSKSDVDFAVMGQKPLSLKELADLTFLFSQLVKLKDVELVDLKSAPPLLLKQLSNEGILLFEKEPFIFLKFRIYALKRYFESRPLLELRRLSLAKFLNPS